MDNIAASIDLHAKGRPTHSAIVCDDRTLTYAELASAIRTYAGSLRERGLGRGSRVAIALGDTPEHLVALYAAARIGAVFVPLDIRWSPAEKKRTTEAAGVRFALCETEDDAAVFSRCGIDAEVASPLRAADAATVEEGCERRPEQLTVALSSGTTGAPKGPPLTHAHMIERFVNQAFTVTLNAHDRFLAATPLYFGAGRSFCMSHLFMGATIVLAPPPRAPADLPPLVESARCTTTFMVPTQLRRLLALDDTSLKPMRRLRLLITSGAPLHPEERRAVRERITPHLLDYYGSTEGGGITVLPPAEQDVRPGSVGRAAFGVDLEIVDDDDRPVPAGRVGQVRYRSPGMPAPDELGEAAPDGFRDGWYYPGDVGALDADGYLTLSGRGAARIIRGGVNIYPTEIEAVIAEMDGIADVAVIGVPDEELGEDIVACIVTRAPVTEEGVVHWCRERLAPYKLPRRVVVLPDLPRNSSGKVSTQALRRRITEK